MELSDEAVEYLAEIRDLQREHLDEYRRVTARLMDLQERAMLNQAAAVGRQKVSMAILAGMLLLLGLFLFGR